VLVFRVESEFELADANEKIFDTLPSWYTKPTEPEYPVEDEEAISRS